MICIWILIFLSDICIYFFHSYEQLTQIHPEVDEYKLYYAQVGRFKYAGPLYLLYYIHKLRTRTSEPMSTATCTLQVTHTVHDLKWNQQTINGSKITATINDQSLQLSRFDDQSHQDKTDLSESRPETYCKYRHLTMTLQLTLRMTTAQVVETSVSKD